MTLSLARRAERFPDRTAVVDVSEERLYAPAETVHEDRVSYAELSAIAERTADGLSAREVGPGDTVCLVTRNRVASLALLFACRRLGATLAPISHRLTPATVERPFEALEPALVVAEAAQRDLVRSIPFDRSVTLGELAETDGSRDASATRALDANDANSDRPAGAESPLVALHGDSGRPVAAFSARALEWNCIAAVVTWGLSSDDSGMVLEPLSSTDGLIRTALPLLYVGGTLLLDRAFDPGDALTAIADHEVTTLVGREPALHDLAAAADADAISGLERAICDSSTGTDVLEPFLEFGASVFSAYGRLECPTATSGRVSRADDENEADDETGVGRSALENGVGQPVLDCRARLVDDGAVLEGAAEGRLQLSGPVVADGYVGPTDDETDAGGQFTDGWFDTGDRFRRDADGRYYRP